uniref:NR LBD domain-containing protein n=1 Tax=Rhabditophanes sp. KR3021 TaxID=114890 RepID=A0AC35TZU3_9BILA
MSYKKSLIEETSFPEATPYSLIQNTFPYPSTQNTFPSAPLPSPRLYPDILQENVPTQSYSSTGSNVNQQREIDALKIKSDLLTHYISTTEKEYLGRAHFCDMLNSMLNQLKYKERYDYIDLASILEVETFCKKNDGDILIANLDFVEYGRLLAKAIWPEKHFKKYTFEKEKGVHKKEMSRVENIIFEELLIYIGQIMDPNHFDREQLTNNMDNIKKQIASHKVKKSSFFSKLKGSDEKKNPNYLLKYMYPK